MSSNFALKTHALQCRPYPEGRDRYDFNWYIAQGIAPNLELLKNALIQYGPWAGKALEVDRTWLLSALSDKIGSIDWQQAVEDVKRFLKPVEQKSLSLWSEKYYMSKLARLKSLMQQPD